MTEKDVFKIIIPLVPDNLHETKEKSSGKSSEKSSEKILGYMKENKNITIAELSQKLGISTRAVEKHISKLKQQGKIKRIGPDKGGYWEVIKDEI
jgi:ATP-dependent DNA helicase RecG